MPKFISIYTTGNQTYLVNSSQITTIYKKSNESFTTVKLSCGTVLETNSSEVKITTLISEQQKD